MGYFFDINDNLKFSFRIDCSLDKVIMLEWLHFVGEHYACQRERLYLKHLLQIGKIVYEFIQVYYMDTTRPDDDVWLRDRSNHLKTIQKYIKTGQSLSPSKPINPIQEGFDAYLLSENIESTQELESHLTTVLTLLDIQTSQLVAQKMHQD